MQYRSVKGYSGWSELGILLVFFGLGFILAGAVQLLIGLQIIPPGTPTDKMAEEMLKSMLKPENISYARLSQVLGTFCLLFIPASLYLIVCHGKSTFWLGFNKHINGWQVLIGFFLIFLASVIANPLAEVSKQLLHQFKGLDSLARSMEDSYNDQVAGLSNLKSWKEFLMALVIMAFFPALFEEIFFRGAVQNLLERWWKLPLLAILVTSLLFSLIHMSVYLFLSRAVLGFVLGLMYQRSRNLWVNIVAHFLNNTVALVQLFWMANHQGKIEPDKIDPNVPIWGGLIAVAFTYGLFLLFEKVSKKNREKVMAREQTLRDKADPFFIFPSKQNT